MSIRERATNVPMGAIDAGWQRQPKRYYFWRAFGISAERIRA
jgi:hypothetical protein